MITIVVVVGLELNYGLLLGTHDFFAYNALRFAQTDRRDRWRLVVLWMLDALTVESGADRRHGGQRGGPGGRDWRAACPASASGASTGAWACAPLWYGVRGQGNTVASSVNARLDVAMLPAFVAPPAWASTRWPPTSR